jgi:hypothetical protein
VTLCTHSEIPVKRFIKVKGRATPMNPDESDYWERRKRARLMDAIYSKRRKHLLQRQGGACAMCGVQFDPDEDTHFIDMHHDRTRRSGGSDQPPQTDGGTPVVPPRLPHAERVPCGGGLSRMGGNCAPWKTAS